MVKQFFQIRYQNSAASASLLIIRLAMGIAFLFHGWGKIQAPFGWMPEQAPMHIPPFFQFLSALAEFGGGIALLLGAITAVVSLSYIINMSVAVYTHLVVRGDPFVSLKGGPSYELALVYLVIAVMFFIFGPGKFSLDNYTFGAKTRNALD